MRSLCEAKTFGYCLQIEGMDIKNLFNAVSCICVQIRFESIDCLAVEIVIFTNQQLKVILNFLQLALLELILIELNFSLKQMLEISSLLFN